MSELNDADGSFSPLNYNNFIDWLLYGNTFDGKKKRNISISTIQFIKDHQRFDAEAYLEPS